MDASMQDATSDTGTDATVDACGNACTGAAPICNATTMQCVACLENTDCSGATPICDATDNTCVECRIGQGTTDCSGNSCNPANRTCTSTTVGSLAACDTCVADEECETNATGTLRCVPMDYQSSPHGTYCLLDRATITGTTCPTKVYIESQTETSTSGVASTYCSPAQSQTTCEAVTDYKDLCTLDTDCGHPSLGDGLCRDDGAGLRCTYECSGDDDCSSANKCRNTMPSNYCCTAGSGPGCS